MPVPDGSQRPAGFADAWWPAGCGRVAAAFAGAVAAGWWATGAPGVAGAGRPASSRCAGAVAVAELTAAGATDRTPAECEASRAVEPIAAMTAIAVI